MMRLIEELGLAGGRVRIPDGTGARLTRRVVRIVDHPAFQRLRSVRQLGPTHLVYPGAVHTRFEHSLGVYDTVCAFLTHLLRVPAFGDRVSTRDCLAVLAAGLLHDLGHYPMAHSLEALHAKGNDTPRHEDLAGDIIRGHIELKPNSGPSIGTILAQDWGVDPERVIALITTSPSKHSEDRDALLGSIISGAIDADKMDYLERDSIHMGVPYGRNMDRARLLDSLTVASDGRSIALTSKGKTPAEMFIFGRYVMFSEAYWHHTVRATSAMVEAALGDLQDLGCLPADRKALAKDVLTRSDDVFLEWLRSLAPRGSQAATILDGMVGWERKLYKRVLTLHRVNEGSPQADAWEILRTQGVVEQKAQRERMAQRIRSRFGVEITARDLWIDTPPRDKDKMEDMEILSASGERQTLSDMSGIVRGIARDFISYVKKIRVFVDPDIALQLADRRGEVAETLLDEILVGGA